MNSLVVVGHDGAVEPSFLGARSKTTSTTTTGLRHREQHFRSPTTTVPTTPSSSESTAAPDTKRLRRIGFHGANTTQRCCIAVLILGLLVAMSVVVWYWNQRAVWKQHEAPLDHIKTVLLKPFWAWTCPIIPNLVAITTSHTTLRPTLDDNNQTATTTTPPPLNGPSSSSSSKTRRNRRPPAIEPPIVVPVVMISARPAEQATPVYQTWSQNAVLMDAHERYEGAPQLVFSLVNTADFSRRYQNTKCAQLTFASRLFAVYQHVLTRLLNSSSEHSTTAPRHFVVLEDDVVLLDATRFLAELKWAMDHDVGFYSFQLLLPEYLEAAASTKQVGPTLTHSNASLRGANLETSSSSSSRQRSCVYQFSTTAQVISRRLAQQIVHADTDSFCRLPIDMYIARAGPWYSTVHAVTRHVGQRLSLVPKSP
jgi:hypothetical protein